MSAPTATRTDDPRFSVAFPTLSDEEIRGFQEHAETVRVPEDEYVWKAGDRDMCMYVIVSGEMSILDQQSGEVIVVHTRGQFSGDIDVLSGRSVVVTGHAKTDLELVRVSPDCVRTIVGTMPALGNRILSAFLMRRSMLQSSDRFGLRVIGSRYSPDTLRIREFLSRNRLPFRWDDLEEEQGLDELLETFNVCEGETPLIILPNGDQLRVPSNLDLARNLGISRPVQSALYDLVVIGAGPAGLAAGVYGASEGLQTLVIDASGPGGQAGTSARIENYMGFPTGVSGQELADRAVVQAERFGAELMVPAAVKDITCNQLGGHVIRLDGQGELETRCVILATGATYRKLDVPGMERFEGCGIYYACTNIERTLCKDSTVAVVGAGNSAGQAAVFLAEKSKHVLLIVRGPDLRKTMSSYLATRIEQSDKITVLLRSEICQLEGDAFLAGATIVDRETGQARTEEFAGVFVMIGADPRTDWLPPSIKCDPKGFVLTGQSVVKAGEWTQERPPFHLETSCPGVFAAGDIRSDSVKRVASAVGEGSMSVAFVHQYLAL